MTAAAVSELYITEQAYLSTRLDDQINWYANKSTYCQNRHKLLRVVEVLSAALIPFLLNVKTEQPYFTWAISALGVLITVCAASSGIFKFHENWIQYRATSEQLKQEKYLFLAHAQPYAGTDAFQTLVQRVEGLISKENVTWAQTLKATGSPANGAPASPTPAAPQEAAPDQKEG
jgi:hypothetical protein